MSTAIRLAPLRHAPTSLDADGLSLRDLVERQLELIGEVPVPGWSTMRELPQVPDSTFREWWRTEWFRAPGFHRHEPHGRRAREGAST